MPLDKGITEYISTYGADPAFTPNNAVLSVPVVLTNPAIFYNIATNPWFQRGETVLIHSIYIGIPYQWAAGELGPININLGWLDGLGNFGGLDVFSGTGRGNIPQVEHEFPIQTIVETPAAALDKWSIRLDLLAGLNMSMVNSPAALNTIVQYPRVNLYVRHTLTMIP